MIVINNLYTDQLKGISLVVDGVTCVLGDWGEDKKSLISSLLGKSKYVGEIKFYRDKEIDKKQAKNFIRVIPRELEKPKIDSITFIKVLLKNYGENINPESILNILDIKNDKISNLSEYEVFNLYLSSLLIGKAYFIIAEDFLELMEEQLKYKALKNLIKVANMINADLILFSSSTKNLDPCKRIYVIYGGKLIEESYGKELLHPYSLALLNSKITIGNKGEKIPVREISSPSDHGCPFHDYCDLMQKEKWLSIKCRLQDPPMFIVKGNRVSCWYYEKGV
ncbi:hypothetical protein [Acidianus ambivalens]|uniref:ATP-binding cassette domain-containing protein n=1 Tax=Acidianus ambivalens TaxID=2283 RepID=A0A650CUT3_ACIAM|nr:hypothetical protein [Acidianus ambivalens]MQL55913.1 hypothetical protein [Acidianus ambivalens]QGR21523.1 hypothetical protein D1866_05625 [Acidianus ambivalens]